MRPRTLLRSSLLVGILASYFVGGYALESPPEASYDPARPSEIPDGHRNEEDDADLRRTRRQLSRILDPFGILDKTGKAFQGALDEVGQSFQRGMETIDGIMDRGAARLESAFGYRKQKEKERKTANVHQVYSMAENIAGSVSALGHRSDGNKVNGTEEGKRPLMSSLREGINSFPAHQLEAQLERMAMHESASAQEPVYLSNHVSEEAQAEEEIPVGTPSLIERVLLTFGVETGGFGLILMNVFIFITESLVSHFLGIDDNIITGSKGSKEPFLERIISGNAGMVEEILQKIKDPNLPKHIINTLSERTGDTTACVQLLVCKISPAIWSMQRAMDEMGHARSYNSWTQNSGILNYIYEQLPLVAEYLSFSRSCERQFPHCSILHLHG